MFPHLFDLLGLLREALMYFIKGGVGRRGTKWLAFCPSIKELVGEGNI